MQRLSSTLCIYQIIQKVQTQRAGDAAAEATLRGLIAQQTNIPAWQVPLSIFCSVKVVPFLV